MKTKKEAFEEATEKQLRTSRKIFLLVYGIIGIVFLALALVMAFCDVRDPEDGVPLAVIFAPIGGFFLILGIVLYAVMPKRLSYEKYEKRCAKYGVQNIYAMSAELAALKEQMAEIEQKLSELEQQTAASPKNQNSDKEEHL